MIDDEDGARAARRSGARRAAGRRARPRGGRPAAPRRPELEQERRVALEHDQEPADAVDERSPPPSPRPPPRIMSALSRASSAEPDDAGGEALQRRDPTLGGLAAPDGLGSDDLRRDAGGDAEERAADQRGENDDGRRGRVPAARPELDDDALGRGRRDDERDRDRQRRLERRALGADTQSAVAAAATSGIPIATRVPRDGSATPGAGRQSSAWAPSPACRSWARHVHSSNPSDARPTSPDQGKLAARSPLQRPPGSAAAEGGDRQRERDLVAATAAPPRAARSARARPARPRSAAARPPRSSRARRAPA